MVKAQEYINRQYLPFIRKNIKEININNQNLERELAIKKANQQCQILVAPKNKS